MHPSTQQRRIATITGQLAMHPTNAASAPAAAAPSSSSASNQMPEVWIVGYARTPIGGGPIGGALSHLSAPELGSIAIRGAVQRSGVDPRLVEEVFMGLVLSGGVGQAPARQAALKAGLPESVPCTTVNKVCASGLKCVSLAADAIRSGSRDIVVAGGMESMSRSPFLLARGGLKMGHATATDSMIHDGLSDAYHQHVHMGTAAELMAQKMSITRAEQDAYARRSYERAQAATKAGVFEREIVPVEVKGKDGKMTLVRADEEVFRAKFDRFGTLKPSFPTIIKGVSPAGVAAPPGTVTAANSSTIGDGAAALVLMSSTKAKELGLRPLARVLAHADAALTPLDYGTAPEPACRSAIAKAGLSSPANIDLWEVNEAFSAVALANMRLLSIPEEQINVFGGAVALGHPIGCSGARIVCTLLTALQAKDKQYGCAALCNGGGGATALVVQRM